MSGLEKILKHIENNANNNAQELIDKANNESEKILNTAKNEANQRYAQIIEKGKEDAKAYINYCEASALLQEKKIILDAKQQLIKDLINQAKDYIVNLSKEEYFDIILKMLKKYCMAKSGQIIFSKYDKERMPDGFQDEINKIVYNIAGASLTISDKTSVIDGGFILDYGDIEQNCSFDALFLDKKDLLQDEVYKLLFEEKAV